MTREEDDKMTLQVSWMIADHGFFLLLQVRQGDCLHLEEMDKTMDDVVFQIKVDVENTLVVKQHWTAF